MSLLAVFNLIETSKLSDLRVHAQPVVVKKLLGKKTIDNYWNYLQTNSTILYGLNPDDLNGGILLNIIQFLNNYKKLNLQDSAYIDASADITEKQQRSTLILTTKHKTQFNDIINVATISLDECRAANIEFSDDDSDESVAAFIEGLTVLRNVLNQIQDDNSVIIFTIG